MLCLVAGLAGAQGPAGSPTAGAAAAAIFLLTYYA